MTRNYFYKNKLVGQDCRYCDKRVKLKEKHREIKGIICSVAHLICEDELTDLVNKKVRQIQNEIHR